MTTYTGAQATSILRNLGFRVSSSNEYAQSLRTFQAGYNLGAWLAIDGQCGPITSAALARCEVNRRAGRSTASAHFSWTEFRCTCGGRYPGCRVILVRRELLQSLEKYRAKVGPTSVVSGYRCPSRNKAVKGALNSQHQYGGAADIDYALTWPQVVGLRAFAGIGKSVRTGKVRHVDRRDKSGHNTTGSSLARPQIWDYPQ